MLALRMRRSGGMRADDAPPYFTILIVGHVLVPLVFVVEKAWNAADVAAHGDLAAAVHHRSACCCCAR